MSEQETRIDISGAIAYLNRNIHRFRRESSEGVKFLAQQVAGALATATRISPKTRPIVSRVPGAGPPVPGIWYAKRIRSGSVKYSKISAATKQEARNDKAAIIRRRGLARMAWFWVLQDVGGGSKSVPGSTMQKNRRAYGVKRQLAGNDPAILIQSKLPYASDAFKIKGRATVYNVGERALGRVKRMIERRLASAS